MQDAGFKLKQTLSLLIILVATLLATNSFADVQPSSGPVYGGTLITITGSNFDSSATVDIGGQTALNVTFVNSTTITAITPESFSEGTFDVNVYTASNSFTFPSAFTFINPTISNVAPSEGFVAGGTPITISGAYFSSDATVNIDSNPASNVNVVDANTITAITPPGNMAGPVTVTVAVGAGMAEATGTFTYLDPIISSIAPAFGPIAGGTPITISGAYFSSDATVDIDFTPANNVNVVDANTITAITPPGNMAGPVTVTVAVGAGMTETTGTFTYLDPTVSSITPASGVDSGGTPVTISGANFSSPATVDFGGNFATAVTVVDENTITAVTPSGTGTVDVSVNTDYASATLSQGFSYITVPTPQITSISPQTGDSNGGVTVTITGADFQSGATVVLGAASMNNITFIDSTTLTAVTPALSAGTYSLTVTNPDGKADTLTNIFTVTQAPQGFPAGDLAPRGNPDGQLNTGDLVVLQRLVAGEEIPTTYELLVGDVAPLNSPDGVLNAGDLLILTQAVAGQITLPPVFDTNPPQITILSPADGSTVTQSSISVNGILDEPADVTINSISLGTVSAFNLSLILNQGANIITITATDSSNNTAVKNITVYLDSRAPNPVGITKLTASILGNGQVSFTGADGASEPGATVRFTNITTGVTTTVSADANNGSFTQLLNANAGDVIIIALIDSAGNTSKTISYTVGASIQIVAPFDNEVIEPSTTNVSGLFTGSINDGIMVNGVPPCVFGNAFYINHFRLQTGANSLNAVLSDQAGATSQHTITVSSNNNDSLIFKTETDCGIAPLDVSFDLDTGGIPVSQINIDYDGDGAPEISTSDPTTALSYQYATPGVYAATLWLVDNQGNDYEQRLNIVVQDQAAQDALFQQIWSNFTSALSGNDINTALSVIKTTARGIYDPTLQALAVYLPEIAGDLSGIEKIRINENFAEYAVLTVVDNQVKTFVVTFTRDEDGIWRIASM